MDIKEVMKLKTGTKVKVKMGLEYVFTMQNGVLLTKYGTPVEVTKDVINAEYELVGKKLNFFEAMKLVDEGKIVENNFYKYIYKKDTDRCLVCKEKGTEEEFNMNDICVEEISSNWYEVTE